MNVEPLWTPSQERIGQSHLARFQAWLAARGVVQAADYDALYTWSVSDYPRFWSELLEFAEIELIEPPERVLDSAQMPGARWFPGATLNFAQNLLRFRDDRVALLQVDETGAQVPVRYDELYRQVARMARFLSERGVGPGDRVAAFLPNRAEAVITMLAASSLGAIFSSCSPDFGFKGVMDRFGQIEPRILVACDGYRYGGKRFSSVERIAQVAEQIASIEAVVVVPILGEEVHAIRGAILWDEALAHDTDTLEFAALPFDHPLYIMYSSGTTGVPKCIVHGAGGTLLQHAKEHLLHCDLRRDDVLFYFTTCGWMMWNWLVSGLFVGATLVLYDGSPAFPDTRALFELAQRTRMTHLGTSPKFLATVQKAGLRPGEAFDLSALRVLMSTGAPLSEALFRWTYEAIKSDLQLASISGGTDIISCFMLGCPTAPVYPGEIQKRGLGMKVEAWAGPDQPVIGQKGELVCTAPFPSMPVGFWNDPEGERYREAYFSHYPGVWRHGDWIEITPRGGVIVYGRSDATLNPGGVRIGTAEIYRVVEGLNEVVDSLVIGQRWRDDVRVLLFVVLRDGLTLDEDRIKHIKKQIRAQTTPRHVPALVLQVPEVPRTLSGKKVELAVSRLIHGEPVTNLDALANPGALEAFAALPLHDDRAR